MPGCAPRDTTANTADGMGALGEADREQTDQKERDEKQTQGLDFPRCPPPDRNHARLWAHHAWR